MADYKLSATSIVIREADNAFIPDDAGNVDRIAFNQWVADGGVPDPYLPPVVPSSVTPQDLMAQFTPADATAIQSAIAGNMSFWLLWQSMIAQRDPMMVTNARFLAGWNALVTVLGQSRMNGIATALSVPSLVVN